MIVDNVCLILLPNQPILVEKEKTQVELGHFYYEPNNHIPVYQFTKDTLPTQYYLQKVISQSPINALPPNQQEEIGWFDIESITNEYTKRFCDLDSKEQANAAKYDFTQGFNKASQLLSKKTFTIKDMLTVRNKLYDMLPTGEITAFEYVKTINDYFVWLDKIIDNSKNPPQIDVKVLFQDNQHVVTKLI